jgi:hypothetical protein
MLSVNRGFFDPSVSEEIMSCASGKFSAALKSLRGQCSPVFIVIEKTKYKMAAESFSFSNGTFWKSYIQQ